MTTPAAEEIRQTGAESIVWDLSVFYTSLDDPRIDADMAEVNRMADEFAAKYRGRVAELDPEELYEAILANEAMEDLGGRIGSYASLKFSEDAADPRAGALLQKVQEFGAEVNQKTVFFGLEWNELDDAAAARIISHPTLEKFRFQLESARRYKPYQLSEIEEQLLMEKDVTGASAWTRFFSQLMSAMRFDLDGQKLNQAQIFEYLRRPDREQRAKAAAAITAALKDKKMELTYIFNVLAADKAQNDRRRGYETWISSRNLSNLAPDSVVNALIEAVTSSYDIVAKHYNIKRVLLGLPELTDIDRYAPLALKKSDAFYTWEEARDLVLGAFNAFSPKLAETARLFFDNGWIHAAPLPNKRGGAFASPTVPSAHPFVFLTFLGTPNNVSTLAHELGHGMHMYLSGQAHGFQGLYTPLTTAEMASVFAEMLVFQDLRAREADPEARLAMLFEKVEDSFATVFRQTAMNRFEDGMHTARRTEGELSTERLNQIWMETQQAMFQDSVILGEQYSQWWSYIPHFLHTPGYVYAYAFGELLVLALYGLYQERGASFVPDYVDVLEAGGSDYPDKILAKVGVDLNDPSFWQRGLDAIRALVDEEERLAKQLYPEKFA
jgi:oligoendopeptidase F